MKPGEKDPDDEAYAIVGHPDTEHETHLISVDELPEPKTDPDAIIDPADNYAEGVDAIPGTNIAKPRDEDSSA